MTTLLLVLSLAAALDGDPLRPGRDALHALDYEKAVAALAQVAEDDALATATRARAYMLIAEARFGMAHVDSEARARNALRKALALDPRIDFENRDDVSPRLLAIFDPLRAPAPSAAPSAASSAASSVSVSVANPSPLEAKPAEERRAEPVVSRDDVDADGVSPWWIASAGLATTAVVASAIAGGFAYRIYNLPPGLSSSEVRGTQAAGIAALVVAGGAGVAALATSTVALVE
jgi:hypothetical protein